MAPCLCALRRMFFLCVCVCMCVCVCVCPSVAHCHFLGATCSSRAHVCVQPEIRRGVLKPIEISPEERGDCILFQVQTMFAHLLHGRPQYYVPEGFWKAYRHWGEPVNVREQQDAREFFDNFVDQVCGAKLSVFTYSCFVVCPSVWR
jgi:hypothetical protein